MTHYERTILESIDLEAYDIDTENMSEFEQIKEVHKIFLKEKGYEIKRIGEKQAFADWLQGLPTVLTVPFYNKEILDNALLAGFNLMFEESEENYLCMYWTNLASAFFNLYKIGAK